MTLDDFPFTEEDNPSGEFDCKVNDDDKIKFDYAPLGSLEKLKDSVKNSEGVNCPNRRKEDLRSKSKTEIIPVVEDPEKPWIAHFSLHIEEGIKKRAETSFTFLPVHLRVGFAKSLVGLLGSALISGCFYLSYNWPGSNDSDVSKNGDLVEPVSEEYMRDLSPKNIGDTAVTYTEIKDSKSGKCNLMFLRNEKTNRYYFLADSFDAHCLDLDSPEPGSELRNDILEIVATGRMDGETFLDSECWSVRGNVDILQVIKNKGCSNFYTVGYDSDTIRNGTKIYNKFRKAIRDRRRSTHKGDLEDISKSLETLDKAD